jgi:hypothetical protein
MIVQRLRSMLQQACCNCNKVQQTLFRFVQRLRSMLQQACCNCNKVQQTLFRFVQRLRSMLQQACCNCNEVQQTCFYQLHQACLHQLEQARFNKLQLAYFNQLLNALSNRMQQTGTSCRQSHVITLVITHVNLDMFCSKLLQSCSETFVAAACMSRSSILTPLTTPITRKLFDVLKALTSPCSCLASQQ